MRTSLKYALALSCGLLAVTANAQTAEKPTHNPIIYAPAKGVIIPKAGNLVNHGGPVITSAKVVFIFWGPTFANAASADHAYATTLQAFRNQFGTTGEYNVITQYSGILKSNLGSGTADLFDTSTPPARVTDALVQSKVQSYINSHGGSNSSTIYEVVIPKSSFSDDGSGATSCGGTNLQYCAYHSSFGNTKYSIQPYPSCSGCKVSGWSDVQNQEHFACHETREAVTDPLGTAWWDTSGAEADDKCAWSPSPFIGTNGFSYQYEWSNASSSCVRTR